MKLLLAALLLLCTGCAVTRAVYCDKRNTDGTCAHWAKQRTDCVHQPDGSCTNSTR